MDSSEDLLNGSTDPSNYLTERSLVQICAKRIADLSFSWRWSSECYISFHVAFHPY